MTRLSRKYNTLNVICYICRSIPFISKKSSSNMMVERLIRGESVKRDIMRKWFTVLFSVMMVLGSAQSKKTSAAVKAQAAKPAPAMINPDIPALIPTKRNGLFGFANQQGKVIIKPEYSNVGFFTEDCNLLNSPNVKARKFGSANYASVRRQGVDFRIDRTGKRVYQYKDADLAQCPFVFMKQRFHAYVRSGFYGIIEQPYFKSEDDYRSYVIYPQYQYLHILEGDDLDRPMIVASQNDRFGIIDINNNVVIPFEYSDIKRNYSWKLAKLFEVTKDGVNYFYIDAQNKGY